MEHFNLERPNLMTYWSLSAVWSLNIAILGLWLHNFITVMTKQTVLDSICIDLNDYTQSF